MSDFDNKDLNDDNFSPDIGDAGDEPSIDYAEESNLADDSTPAGVDEDKSEDDDSALATADEDGATDALPAEGTTRSFDGIQDNPETDRENQDADGSSLTALEPPALEEPLASDENEEKGESAEEAPHISSSGNKIFEEAEALSNVGKVHQANTTAAYIEVVQHRIPGLESALRAQATESGLADGSIKPEDAPGFKVPEGGIEDHNGGNPEDGNSITGATKPTEDSKINPNTPIQVGDTKETAQAASNAKIENGDATGEIKSYATDIDAPAKDGGAGDLGENETTTPSAASSEVEPEFKANSPELLQEKL